MGRLPVTKSCQLVARMELIPSLISVDCRDPNLQQTLDRFASSAVWAANGEFTDRDIDEAKLSVFSQVTITLLTDDLCI